MKSLILFALCGSAFALTAPAPDECMALSGCKNCLAKDGCQYVPAVGMCVTEKRRIPELVWFDVSQCPAVEAPFRQQCLTYSSCKDCIDNKCAWGSQAILSPTGSMTFTNGSCHHSLTCPGPHNTNGGVIVCFDKAETCPSGTASTTPPPATLPMGRPLPRPMPRPNFGCPIAKPTTGAACPTGANHPRMCAYDIKCGCLNQSLCVSTTEAECREGIWFVSHNPSKCIQA